MRLKETKCLAQVTSDERCAQLGSWACLDDTSLPLHLLVPCKGSKPTREVGVRGASGAQICWETRREQ